MSKRVLISFLGTGTPRIVEDGIRPMREYRKADYRIEEDTYKDFTFMSAALARHYAIDKILMVGTVHSMWEELYRWFHDAKNEEKVEDDEATYNIYKEIGEHCETADHGSELSMPHLQAVEQVMGKGSKVVLIKYGIDEEEIRENINRILGLEQYLETNDELIVDITHSFRSLPIFIMNLLIYLQNVSPKKITISHIHYGMNEASREFGYSPVVDLKAMMDVQEWIIGAYAFSMFGNTYKMAKLLESDKSQDYSKAAKSLRKFADLKNLNRLSEFRKEISSLNPLMNNEMLPPLGQVLIPDIIGRFTKRFPANLTDYEYKFRMAEWHERHHNYGYAFINLLEAALSYCCELVPDSHKALQGIMDVKSCPKRKAIGYALCFDESKTKEKNTPLADNLKQLREYLKDMMSLSNVEFSQFNLHYDKIDYDRNTLSHVLERNKTKDYKDSIDELKEGLKYFGPILQT